MAEPPSPAELRRIAETHGVTPTDEDLEAVRGFLAVLLPAFEELERLRLLRRRPASEPRALARRLRAGELAPRGRRAISGASRRSTAS